MLCLVFQVRNFFLPPLLLKYSSLALSSLDDLNLGTEGQNLRL